jgi:hypothetical protein
VVSIRCSNPLARDRGPFVLFSPMTSAAADFVGPVLFLDGARPHNRIGGLMDTPGSGRIAASGSFPSALLALNGRAAASCCVPPSSP